MRVAGQFYPWGSDFCLRPEDSKWRSPDGARVPFALASGPDQLPGEEGFEMSFLEIETRNLYGPFAFDAGYTRYAPAFRSSVYVTEINSPTGCDL